MEGDVRMQNVDLGIIRRCIYCGTDTKPLQNEHIIPLGLGGIWVLREASCDKCAAITSRFERDVQKLSLRHFRATHCLPTRRKNERPRSFQLKIRTEDGNEGVVEVPVNEALFPINLPVYHPPAYLDGRPYEKGITIKGWFCMPSYGQALAERALKHGASQFGLSTEWIGLSFERMLAKIGYGFTVATFGIDKLQEVYVLPTILGQKDDVGRWVGCDTNTVFPLHGEYLHMMGVMKNDENNDVISRVKLFAVYDAPEYVVVAGRLKK